MNGRKRWVYVCEKQNNTERERGRVDFSGFAILTICEGLEAHLAAVFAKASHSPCSHLYHVDSTGPEALHTGSIRLAAQHSGINLCMILKEKGNTHRGRLDIAKSEKDARGIFIYKKKKKT